MLDPAKVLKAADELVRDRDRWAAFPSTDVGVAAVTEVIVGQLNAELRDWTLRVLGLIGAINEPEKFNYMLDDLRKMIGE
jgi:hypothetical protein